MRLYSFILALILLSSCKPSFDQNDSSTWGNVTDYYYKSFFLGETSISIEGEIFKDPPQVYYKGGEKYYAEPPLAKNGSFDSLVAKIRYKPKSDTSNNYQEWKFPANKLSESKFKLPVDITAIDTTIDNNYVGVSNFINSSANFPAFELEFYLDNDKFKRNPIFQEPVNNDEYRLFMCTYMYFAEPLDRTTTYVQQPNEHTHDVVLHHYDLNFSKPGWYKIIERFYREIDDDPKFSTVKNNHFFTIKE